MTTALETSAAAVAQALASAAATALGAGSPLTAGELMPTPVELPFRHAVVAPLGGAVGGELALFVDDAFAEALMTAPVGQLDLAEALAPILAAVGAQLPTVVPGPAQATDARLAAARIDAHAESVVIGLDDGVEVRAAVAVGMAVGIDPNSAATGPAAGFGAQVPVGADAVPAAQRAERLDLLRGVEMAATVELGRARMTVNDLLSLRDGAIVELDRAAGDAADLYVNGRLIARGEVVVVDENYALRITQIAAD